MEQHLTPETNRQRTTKMEQHPDSPRHPDTKPRQRAVVSGQEWPEASYCVGGFRAILEAALPTVV
jgi:hypothetical protein